MKDGERSFLRKWIFEHTEEEWRKEVNDMIFLSYPYEKYGEFVLAFRAVKLEVEVMFPSQRLIVIEIEEDY